MALSLQDKKKIIIKVNEVSKNALSAVIADYSGIKVNKITELRKTSRKLGVYIYVMRNTLIRRVVENTKFECLKNTFIGPTMIAFSHNHPGTAARIFKKFSKENANFKIKIAYFEGKIITESKINSLANLPTYEESISRIILILKEASCKKLMRTLIELNKKKITTKNKQ